MITTITVIKIVTVIILIILYSDNKNNNHNFVVIIRNNDKKNNSNKDDIPAMSLRLESTRPSDHRPSMSPMFTAWEPGLKFSCETYPMGAGWGTILRGF